MDNNIKCFIKNIIPPIILKLYRKITHKIIFTGNYKTFEEAEKKSSGYDSRIILEKVKNALLKVKNGEAVYERDSVLFDKVEYSFPLLAIVLKVATECNNKVDIIDFGGSLGSTYYQCKNFISSLSEVRWSIVEQKQFVDCGKKYFENKNIKFYYSIEQCLKENTPKLIILSSVLQYLDRPYDFVSDILKYDFKYIFIDRTGFFNKEDRITIQNAQKEIYEASYPAWFFNYKKFKTIICKQYNIISEFDSFEKMELEDTTVQYKGFILEKK